MGFILFWEIEVNGELIEKKMDAKLSEGDFVRIVNKGDEAEILFLASRALNEPVTWARPIVMNTRAEIEEALRELREGSFVKEG